MQEPIEQLTEEDIAMIRFTGLMMTMAGSKLELEGSRREDEHMRNTGFMLNRAAVRIFMWFQRDMEDDATSYDVCYKHLQDQAASYIMAKGYPLRPDLVAETHAAVTDSPGSADNAEESGSTESEREEDQVDANMDNGLCAVQ